MRILITGADSDGTNWPEVEAVIRGLKLGAEVVTGGKGGAEAMAAKVCRDEYVPVDVVKPDWKKHGKNAAFAQVKQLLALDFDEVICIGEPTKSAQQLIRAAHSKGKNIRYVANGHERTVRGKK